MSKSEYDDIENLTQDDLDRIYAAIESCDMSDEWKEIAIELLNHWSWMHILARGACKEIECREAMRYVIGVLRVDLSKGGEYHK